MLYYWENVRIRYILGEEKEIIGEMKYLCLNLSALNNAKYIAEIFALVFMQNNLFLSPKIY